ncbi:MAG: 2-amino-4-hydroxy-6-hydroxymethyldihydropteridine diphosphokinase [Piscirickettsiaceae bacterium]|nr:MAG: 2-amino-4-hydroxy-6-hydroxymethyldihydropteridine diphosphokinase [Piscirickettsiaceae bacterium]
MQEGIYIGLGSNLDQPIQQILTAINHLRQSRELRIEAVSGLYRTPPMGPKNQADYINAVVKLSTDLSPQQLLTFLQTKENEQARTRNSGHWGPRTLDLDLLIYGDQLINTLQLTVPHIGIANRAFVLYPLQDISTHLHIPTLGLVSDLIAQLQEPKPEMIDTLKHNV